MTEPSPDYRSEVHPSGIVVTISRSISDLVAGDDHVLPLTPLADHYAYLTRTAPGGREVTAFVYVRHVDMPQRALVVSPAIDMEGGVEHHSERLRVPFNEVIELEVVL